MTVIPPRPLIHRPENWTPELASRRLLPDQMVIVVVGDREAIEDSIRDLGLGSIEYLDEDGNTVNVARK